MNDARRTTRRASHGGMTRIKHQIVQVKLVFGNWYGFIYLFFFHFDTNMSF